LTIGITLINIIIQILMPEILIKYRHKEESDTLAKHWKVILKGLAFIISGVAIYFICENEVRTINIIMLSIISMLMGLVISIDIRVRIIPNILLLVMLICTTIYLYTNYDITQVFINFGFMCGMVASLLLLTNLLGFSGYFGAGDIKLISVGTYLLGISYFGFTLMWIGMIVAMIISLLPLLLMKKITLKSMIPFGQFISCGILLGMVVLYIY